MLVLVEGLGSAPGEAQTQQSGTASISSSRRSSAYRSRRRSRLRRPSPRTVVRTVGITLPQLRTELTRLESGLGARVQRIEKVVARPPRPAPVVTPPPAPRMPAPQPDTLPLSAALLLAAITGIVGFALGQLWGERATRAASATRPEEQIAGEWENGRNCRPWAQIGERLDATQQRLQAARARMRQLERHT
jgi:hypothetical protein